MIRDMEGRDDRETIGNLLFQGGRLEEVGNMLRRMWGERRYWMNRLQVGGRGGGTQPA